MCFSSMEALGVNAIMRKIHNGNIKTLLYHNVIDDCGAFNNAISSREFDKHLVYLQNNFNIVHLTQLGEFVGLRLDKVNVLLTFDDGFANNFEVAFPLLKEHNLTACFFVVVNCIEQSKAPRFASDYMKSRRPSAVYSTLGLGQIREMAAAGMTIGAHSLEHDDYSNLSFEQGVLDARESGKKLEQLLGREVRAFAFPWGRSQAGQWRALQPDFRRIFTTEHGFSADNHTLMRRNEVADLAHMRAAASGALDAFRAVPKRLRLVGSPRR